MTGKYSNLIWLFIGVAWATCVVVIVGIIANRTVQAMSEQEPAIIYVEVPVEIPVEVPVECHLPHHTLYYEAVGAAMTEEEYHLLAKIVYLESGNQSLLGQRAVVEVVFNRVLDPRFPDNITDVIYQTNPVQFDTVKLLDKAAPTQEQYDAIDAVLAETVPILPADTIYFATYEANGKTYEKIGAHYFCVG